ncbi:MAG TPA: 2'-5' RNA ligase family protein [Candidatus Udaeobacter sp.]|nr:2'-5' RNA ligase family protein [Candidatus Udaeobacter sp.]
MNAPTYHLWFKPSGDAYRILMRTIRVLARELNAPLFEPHISLIGNLEGTEQEITQKSEELARQLEPFQAVLTKASYRDTHFQCLFMLVEETPPLMKAHAVATDFFHKPYQPFMPHLSLVYGSYSEVEKKLVIEKLAADVRTSFEVTGLYLVRADSPEPKDWHEIGPFPMKQIHAAPQANQ